MKKKLLFCCLLVLVGLPLLLMACTPGTVKDPATDTADGATKAEDATDAKPAETDPVTEEPTEEPTEAETTPVEPATDPVETDSVETDPVETPAPETEPETEPVEEETVPANVLSCIRGGEKLAQLIDYSDPANWISMPESPDKPVDVFFIYPSFYGSTTGSAPDDIADIDEPEMIQGASMLSLRGQASVFGDVCNIYMPTYRQLTVACLMGVVPREDVVQYYLSRDVYRALDYYFENCNNGKPFILAGHSQGSICVTEILENYMREHPEYLERMVAAYAIGYSVTNGYMAANPHLKFAESATDTGVIISYNVEGPGNQNQYNCVVSAGAIAINPLSWTRDEIHVPAAYNPGSLNHKNELEVGLADARVDTARGVVVCESVDPALYSMGFAQAFGSQSYHYYDYSLYYVSLRKNVADRVTAYFAAALGE